MKIETNALELARIVEDFFVELSTHNFVGPCDCCGFPVPSPFINTETGDLHCRKCRLSHADGECQ